MSSSPQSSRFRPNTAGLAQLNESEVTIIWESAAGSGGFATVYKAEYAGSHAAVKVILKQTRHSPSQHRRIVEREFSLMAALRHPRIAVVHGFIELTGDKQGYGIVMQLASTTLPTPSKYNSTTLNYAIQIAHGLSFLHETNILHLDLKPENVLVFTGSEGVDIKLTDFGCARYSDEAQPSITDTLPFPMPMLLLK
ncbi:hypothetical protein GEMRC1_012621 [Eukaryota sp. GEM-RC1]